MSGRSVAGFDVPLGHVELWFVRDVADRAGLGAGTEQRSLRTLQNLDAIEIGGIDVEVAIRELPGLIIQVDCDVRPQARRTAALAGLGTSAQAAHENLVLARPVVRRRNVRQKLDVVVQRRDVQLLERLPRHRLNRDRHVLHVLRAPLRGDCDSRNHVGTGFGVGRRRGNREAGG